MPGLEQHRLERQQGVVHEGAQVQLRLRILRAPGIHAGQLQQALHKAAHLLRHREDAPGKAGAGRGVVTRRLQQLRIRQNDGQGRFQLMRGVRHELPLLVPRPGNGPHQPACQQQAHDEEHRKSRRARNGKRADEAVQRRRLGRGVGKNDAPARARDDAVEPQAVIRHLTDVVLGIHGDVDELLQLFAVAQVKIAAARRDDVAARIDLQRKIRHARAVVQTGAGGRLPVIGQRLERAQALGLKALLRKMQHKAERDAQHHGQQGHEDAHELDAELPDHTSATSR